MELHEELKHAIDRAVKGLEANRPMPRGYDGAVSAFVDGLGARMGAPRSARYAAELEGARRADALQSGELDARAFVESLIPALIKAVLGHYWSVVAADGVLTVRGSVNEWIPSIDRPALALLSLPCPDWAAEQIKDGLFMFEANDQLREYINQNTQDA